MLAHHRQIGDKPLITLRSERAVALTCQTLFGIAMLGCLPVSVYRFSAGTGLAARLCGRAAPVSVAGESGSFLANISRGFLGSSSPNGNGPLQPGKRRRSTSVKNSTARSHGRAISTLPRRLVTILARSNASSSPNKRSRGKACACGGFSSTRIATTPRPAT